MTIRSKIVFTNTLEFQVQSTSISSANGGATINLSITSEEGNAAVFNVSASTLDAGIDSLLGWLTTISGAIEVKGLLRE